MECHKCRYRADVTAGRYAHLEFAQTPCAPCELKDGDSFAIEFNENLSGGAASSRDLRRESLVEDVPFPDEPDADSERSVPVSVLWELVVTLLTLPPRSRDVVCWRYAGYKYREIALVQHVTTTAVELRHRKALKRFPLLRCLFPSKAGKQGLKQRAVVAREVRG